jgi:hypothetical protein
MHGRVESENATYVLSGEQAASQGGVRDNLDAELSCSGKEADLGVFDVEREGRVLHLHRSNRVNGVCTAESGGRNF